MEIPENAQNEWRVVCDPIADHPPFRRTLHRVCKICKREFEAPGNRDWCGHCRMEFKCNYCGKWTSFSILKMWKLDFQIEYGCLDHCHLIGTKKKMGTGECCKCHRLVEHRDQFCFGIECGCHDKMYAEHNRSDSMRQIETENGKKYGVRNLIAYNVSDQGRQTSRRTMLMINDLGLSKFIGSEEQKVHLSKLNKQLRDYSYDIPCSKNCKLYRFCHERNVHKKNRFGLCDLSMKHSDAMLKDDDGILYVFSHGQYVPWEDFKGSFTVENTPMPDGFTVIPTFREQDSINWTGRKLLFEQSLIDMNIRGSCISISNFIWIIVVTVIH